MSIYCHFSDCQWFGSEQKIFEHLEQNHRSLLRESNGNLYFDLSFKDLQHETLVLVCNEGLYWLRQELQGTVNRKGITFGIFHIGQSKCQEYTLKMGLRSEGFCQYWGPYQTHNDHVPAECHTDIYDLYFEYQLLEVLNERIPSRKLRLYFGRFDDSEDVKSAFLCKDSMDLRNDPPFADLNIEKLMCGVCLEFIRRDARFCENKHFVCLICFETMWQRRKLRCPTCRGLYLYDCSSDDVETWLQQVKWPEDKDA